MTSSYKRGILLKHTRTSDIYEGTIEDVDKPFTTSAPLFALKVVDPDFYQAPHSIRREIRLLRHLQGSGNENICDLINVDWDIDLVTIVMPLYAMTLDEYLKHHTRKRTRMGANGLQFHSVSLAPVIELDSILLGLLKGLSFIHSQGIIHRDIKPLNLMLPSLQDVSSVKICDFSISYEIGGDNGTELDNAKYTDVGTGIYKAIELCFGVCSYLCEVDIWAMAIMMTLMYLDTELPTIMLPGDSSDLEMSDLMVIKTIFESLGTPSIAPSVEDKRLFWPQMDNDNYHFKQFLFVPNARKSVESLLPRCHSKTVRKVFEHLAVYQSSERASSSMLLEMMLE